MNQDIENIIKKKSKELSILLLGNIQYNDSRDNKEWRNAIIESSTEIISKELSLIADEVLKVVVDKIKQLELIENPPDYFKDTCDGYNEALKDLLSSLSPNKENEIIHKNCGTKSCKGEYKDGVVDYLCKKCDCTFLDNDEQTIIS